ANLIVDWHINTINFTDSGLDEIDTIRKQYGIKKVIITHLEEDWGKSYDDYRELERELNLIYFAYDGLKIRL
ncbi:MAG: hypothetical protein OSJ61_23960, partial [Lachnospiraceae bacterium]|nr:hypothetical protein [Lachnospiraceae bacterium]